MKKHILFILDYFTPHKGGSETVFENIISRLVNDGYKISVLTSRFSSNLEKIEKTQSLTIYRTGKTRLSFVFWALRKGIKIIRSNTDIGFIHTSTYGGAIPASILGKIFHKKVILTVHEIFGKLWKIYKTGPSSRIYQNFERIVFAMHYDVYHCVSYYTMNSLRLLYGVSDEKIKVIYNGVDRQFRDIKKVDQQEIADRKERYGRKDRYILLYYGHSGKSKGLDLLINAVPDIIKNNPDILIVFNLIDSKRDSITKNMILGLEDIISSIPKKYKEYVEIFSGFSMTDLRVLVAGSDVVVAPSISEGFGSVHTETVSMNKPLITTYIGPLMEVLRGKVRFIAPYSSPAIVEAVADVRNGNYEVIPEKIFSRDENVKQIEALYK